MRKFPALIFGLGCLAMIPLALDLVPARAQISNGINSGSAVGCTVAATSGPCIAAGAGHIYAQVQNVSADLTNAIACNWSGAAALNNRSSFMLWPSQSASWNRNLVMPTTALNCIATNAGAQLYVEYR